MKTKPPIGIFCILALIGLLMWWLLGMPKSTEAVSGSLMNKETQGLPSIQRPKEKTSSNESLVRENQRKQLIENTNVPIKFWGKVVDQDGKPLHNVIVKYRVQRASLPYGSGSSIIGTVASASDGLFSIANVRGATLGMEGFVKDGYRLMQNQKVDFGYSRSPEIYVPIPDSPRIYIMAANNAQNNVRFISRELRLPWDGMPNRLALDSGTPSPSGKLVITAIRTASTGHFGWSITLAIDGGELKEAEKETALIAPENGYLPVWRCGYAPDAHPFRFAHDAQIYYMLNGKYGRIKLQIYADAGPNSRNIKLDIINNISGGKNTEMPEL